MQIRKGFKLYFRFSALLLFISSFFCSGTVRAAVNWRIHAGGMSALFSTDKEWIKDNFYALLGCEIQIPIKDRLFIESGVNLRGGPVTFTFWKYDFPGNVADDISFNDFDNNGTYIGSERLDAGVYNGMVTSLNIPVRFGYRLKLKGKNEFQFAFGPYFESALSRCYPISNNNQISVGLTPSIVFKHRALSLGVLYQNSCIYNGLKNRDKNALLFTIGVNFNGRKVDTDKLIEGLSIASSVLDATTTAMSQYVDEFDSSNKSSGSYYNESSYNESSNSNNLSNNVTRGSSNRSARNNDYNTYFKYETIIIKIINGDDTVNKKSDIQRKMRKLREKWTNKGDGWQASPYETR